MSRSARIAALGDLTSSIEALDIPDDAADAVGTYTQALADQAEIAPQIAGSDLTNAAAIEDTLAGAQEANRSARRAPRAVDELGVQGEPREHVAAISVARRCWRGRARTSNLLIQSQAFCRLNYPPRVSASTVPAPNVSARVGSQSQADGRYPAPRHGISHQEAPQAHAQEEAQEDAEAHALPATRRRQVAPLLG